MSRGRPSAERFKGWTAYLPEGDHQRRYRRSLAPLLAVPNDQVLARVTCFARPRDPQLVAVVTTGGQVISNPLPPYGEQQVRTMTCRCRGGHLIDFDRLRQAVERVEHHRHTARRIDVADVTSTPV